MSALKIKSDVTERLKIRVKEYVGINSDSDAKVVILQGENDIIAFPHTFFMMPEAELIELYITKMNHDYMHDPLPVTVELPVLKDRNYIIELHASSEGRVCEVSTHLEHR